MNGQTFREIRQRLEISNVELAEMFGLSINTVERYQMADDCSNRRPIPVAVAHLLLAVREGYLPAEWRTYPWAKRRKKRKADA
jgi:hypothetical protein